MVKQINKQWYKSKTVISAIVGAGIVILSAIFGNTDIITTTAITLASAFGIYGRFQAEGKLII